MKKYKDYQLYCYEKNIEKILKKIVEKDYQVEKEYKNDKRTYVAKIKIEDKEYILKRTYQKNLLKKIITTVKNGSLTTLKNIKKAKENIRELAEIYGVGIKKEGILVEDEFFLMECIDGNIYIEDKYYLKIYEILKKIHSFGYYHGDANPYNFLFDKKENIHIVDTKMKKMILGNYRAHYDMMTFMKYFKNKPSYPYEKNIFYWIAVMIRKIKGR